MYLLNLFLFLFHLLVYLMLRCLSIDELVLLVTYYNKKNVNVPDHNLCMYIFSYVLVPTLFSIHYCNFYQLLNMLSFEEDKNLFY